MDRRESGVLLHPTSLPGAFGIGDLGDEAFRFVEFLSGARQRLWQVLPLGPTGYGDSPYQCFSAFAGNPLLISLETLVREGWLSRADLARPPSFEEETVDYGKVLGHKIPLLARAAARFAASASPRDREAFEAFGRENALWLDDYALFAAVKEAHGGVQWNRWERGIAQRESGAVERWTAERSGAIAAQKVWQYFFSKQWGAVRERCHEEGIRIMGDVPIFVAHDSADVWAHPELFRLASDGSPAFVAGVPPDYFSATGQLWGNPLYRWDVMARSGFQWWIDRLRSTLAAVDLVRLDHFRGFEAYWEVPGTETTAVRGQWRKGPGAGFLDAVSAALGHLPIVAENLGFITPGVEALRERFGLPGMAILQFAFGTDPAGPGFRPYNYSRNLVVYTGTHDNDTTAGWWASAGAGDSTRTPEDIEKERGFCLRYLGTDGREIHWDLIRTALASVANTAIIPLQDILGLGSEARMNLPGRPGGNWRWRYRPGALTDALRGRLTGLTITYGRDMREAAAPEGVPPPAEG